MIGHGPTDATARTVGLELSAGGLGVKRLARVDTVRRGITHRGVDIGDDRVQALGRAGRGRRDVRAELNGAPRPGRRELDDPEAVVEGKVGVEPPLEAPIELLAGSTSETAITTASSFMSTVVSLVA